MVIPVGHPETPGGTTPIDYNVNHLLVECARSPYNSWLSLTGLSLRLFWDEILFYPPPTTWGRGGPRYYQRKSSHKEGAGLILSHPAPRRPSPALFQMFPFSHAGSPADEQRDCAWTPFTIHWVVAAGLAPRWGELCADGDYARETREPGRPDHHRLHLCNSHWSTSN